MPQSNEYMLKQDDAELIYQKRLTAGTNITIDPTTNIISSTGGGGSSVSYSGSLPQGYGDTIGIITIDGVQYPIKIRNLIQGSNINIVQDISTGNLIISSTAQGTRVEPNPSGTPTDTLDTIGINGTVYEIEGGGSGNVADVYVNGTSVLDANDIAQVFSHEEITEISYDNLPSTKFSNNHMYLIKEAGTPPTGEYYNPVIYSEEEREIGVWKNDKPLYAKTYNFNSFVRITNSGADISQYIDNRNDIEILVRGEGFSDDITQAIHSTALWVGYSTRGVIMAYCAEGATVNCITLYYTKITDVAGSGNYTTLGVPAHHYDSNEKVVGTWFGETLYERTLNFTQDNRIYYIPNTSYVKKLVKHNGECTKDNFDFQIPYYDGTDYLSVGNDSNGVRIYSSNYFVGAVYELTIQYTKTTD